MNDLRNYYEKQKEYDNMLKYYEKQEDHDKILKCKII